MPDFEDVWAKRRIPITKVNPDDYQWATYIEDRSPQFKIHRKLGHAHAAILWKFDGYGIAQTRTDMVLYKKEEDLWAPVHEWRSGDLKSSIPWLPTPPTPEEKARERRLDEWQHIANRIDTLIWSLPEEDQLRMTSPRTVFRGCMEAVLKGGENDASFERQRSENGRA